MSREWKPGDVAMIEVDGRLRRAVRGDDAFGDQWFIGGPSHGSRHGWYDTQVSVARPLVVIDPEDADSAAALLSDYLTEAGGLCDHPNPPHFIKAMQAALREFANPTPRIEEPAGLGAVVEDEDGRLWVRSPLDDYPWNTAHRAATGIITAPWSEVNAVRILSPGVPS